MCGNRGYFLSLKGSLFVMAAPLTSEQTVSRWICLNPHSLPPCSPASCDKHMHLKVDLFCLCLCGILNPPHFNLSECVSVWKCAVHLPLLCRCRVYERNSLTLWELFIKLYDNTYEPNARRMWLSLKEQKFKIFFFCIFCRVFEAKAGVQQIAVPPVTTRGLAPNVRLVYVKTI